MFFTLPWMLAGLVGVPALAAIYWLRSRPSSGWCRAFSCRSTSAGRSKGDVSSSACRRRSRSFWNCWRSRPWCWRPRGSASRARSSPDRLFWCSTIRIRCGPARRQARERAREALAKEFEHTAYVARVVLAGSQPRLLGDSIRTAAQCNKGLKESRHAWPPRPRSSRPLPSPPRLAVIWRTFS